MVGNIYITYRTMKETLAEDHGQVHEDADDDADELPKPQGRAGLKRTASSREPNPGCLKASQLLQDHWSNVSVAASDSPDLGALERHLC